METIQEFQPPQPTNKNYLPIIALSILIIVLVLGMAFAFLQKVQVDNLRNSDESDIQQLKTQISNLEQTDQNTSTLDSQSIATEISEEKPIQTEDQYINFQGKRVSLGETFNFAPQDSCVEDTVASLSAIANNNVTIKIKQWNWKKELNTAVEEVTDYTIKDKDCFGARSQCMDVGYRYCFSISTIDSIQSVSYELKEESKMPRPAAL